ncbi:MAG: response regulator [Pseudomonadales bacterium]|nr:response regulator [Pseudomonadales bacterium]
MHSYTVKAKTLNRVSVRDYFYFIEDLSGKLTLNDVLNRPYHGKNRAVDDTQAWRQYTTHFKFRLIAPKERQVWLSLTLSSQLLEKDALIFSMLNVAVAHGRGYILKGNRVLASYRSGTAVPFSELNPPSRLFYMPFDIHPDESIRLILQLDSGVTPSVAASHLWQKDQFLARNDDFIMIYWLYFGVVGTLLLFNVAVFFATRDRVYGYYMLFLFFSLAEFFRIGGFAQALLWPEAGHWNYISLYVFYWLMVASTTLFANQFLDLKQQRFWLYCMNWLAAIVLIVCAIILSLSEYTVYLLLAGPGFIMAEVLYAVNWFNSAFMWRRGNDDARNYCLAWLVFYAFVTGHFFVVIQTIEITAITAITLYAPLIGHAILTLSLFLALVLKIRRYAEQEQLARAESKAKSDFLAKMSHEIRTPMTGVLGMSELMRDMDLNEEQYKCNDVIYASGKALLTVINDILDYSKIEAGKLEIECIPFDLTKLVWEVLKIFRLKANEKNLELLAYIDPELAPIVEGDPARIRQIMINLLGNAFKFTEKGEVILRLECVKPGHEQSEQSIGRDELIRIAVEDTGIGISEEAQAKLFSAFSQAESFTARKYGGTGLGLSICKQLSELMGGAIGVESTLDKGSTFWLTLGLKPHSGEVIPLPVKDIALQGKKVLVVDDSASYRQLLASQAKQWGIEVETEEHGEQALARLLAGVKGHKAFDLLTTDLNMPTMDGFQLAKAVKAQPELADLPIVLWTLSHAVPKATELQGSGITLAVEKPLLAFEFHDVLCQVLDLGQKVQVHQAVAPQVLPVLPKYHILVADDNPINRLVIQSMLKKLNLSSEVVENGLQALQAYQQQSQPYDLLLMDCEMPEMDGFEATEKIRQWEKQQRLPPIHITALTAHVLAEQLEHCKTCGMDDYLLKPIDLDKLASHIHSVSMGENRHEAL